MIRIRALVFLTVFAITGACLADEIRGKVDTVDKIGKRLKISGVIIHTAEAWIENEQDYPLALKDIANGDYIEVEGKFTGLPEIKAKKIDRKKPECGVVKGRITTVDAKKGRILISGITIKVNADTWLEGPNRVKIPLELFARGYEVQCKGNWTALYELTAFKISVE